MRLIVMLLTVLVAACAARQDQFSTALPSLHVGEVAMQSGQPGIALSVASSHLAQKPVDPDALLLRAQAEFELSQQAQAEADFRQVLAARPGSMAAALGLARIITSTDPATAEALLGAVTVQGGATATVWNNLGVAHDLMGRHADAQEAYRKALVADPEMQSAQVNLARSLALSPAPAR